MNFRMMRLKYLIGNFYCSGCGQSRTFLDTTYSCAVKKYNCNHFDIILIRTNDQTFKVKIIFVCKLCNNNNSVELDIGKESPENTIITDDNYSNTCCGNRVELNVFLSETALDDPEQINALLSTFNDNRSNNPSNNNNNRDYKSFNAKNIIEFNEKNKLLVFKIEKTNKTYRIYTKDDVKLKSVLEDLSSQFPEINYNNKKFLVNERNIYPDSTIGNCNLNDNSIILIK